MTAGLGGFRTLGLLGGMGPGATVDFLRKIVQLTPADTDQEHLPVVVQCVPQIPDRTMALLGLGPSPEPALVAGAVALRKSGADFVAIACNTAHHWYDAIRTAAGIPVLHIADSVIDELHASVPPGASVGLLATRGTLLSGFYQHRLLTGGFRVTTPPMEIQTGSVDATISLVKASRLSEAQATVMPALDFLISQGVRAIVLGCTEIPLVVPAAMSRPGCPGPDVAFVDSTLTLAKRCVAHGRGVVIGQSQNLPSLEAAAIRDSMPGA